MSHQLNPEKSDHRWISARAKDSLFQAFLGASSEQDAIEKALASSGQIGMAAFKRSFLEHARKALGLPDGITLPF
jgi:hypothetical protein